MENDDDEQMRENALSTLGVTTMMTANNPDSDSYPSVCHPVGIDSLPYKVMNWLRTCQVCMYE